MGHKDPPPLPTPQHIHCSQRCVSWSCGIVAHVLPPETSELVKLCQEITKDFLSCRTCMRVLSLFSPLVLLCLALNLSSPRTCSRARSSADNVDPVLLISFAATSASVVSLHPPDKYDYFRMVLARS